MFCCPDCFVDKFLQLEIRSLSSVQGKCEFCGKTSDSLIDPVKLTDRFGPLLDLYVLDPSGSNLLVLLQNDWNIFQPFSKTKQENLLLQVSGGRYNVRQYYSTRFLKDKSNLEKWNKFREELKHNNRFFPTNAPDIDHLKPFGSYIGQKNLKGSMKLFRARINNNNTPFPCNKMRKPPKDKTTNGRANPFGISYLYVASDPDTAISEIRPNKSEKVTVAEFKINSTLELADLRDPKSSISPFQLNDEIELELIYKNLPYLSMLGNELSKPIIPQEVNLEYLPSQYLCEIFKHLGFHGIIYKSSVGKGSNYVIFNDNKLSIENCYQFEVTDTKIISRKLRI